MLHLKRNSSDLLATVTAKTSAIAGEVLRPLVLFAGSTVIVVAVGVALLAIDAQIAGATAGIIGAAYLVTVTVNRRRLDRNGRIIAAPGLGA